MKFYPLSNLPNNEDGPQEYLVIKAGADDIHQIRFKHSKVGDYKNNFYDFYDHLLICLTDLFDSQQCLHLFKEFSDSHMQDATATQDIFKEPENVNNAPPLQRSDIEGCLQIAAMYKAIFSFLDVNDRVKVLNAKLMLVFSLWQWLSYIKVISAEITDKIPEFLYDELSFAYKAANSYFSDPDYMDAFKFINFWYSSYALSTGMNEFMIYSMALMPLREEQEETLEYSTPIPPAGFKRTKKFNWDTVVLHPIFKEHRPAKVAVMRLVTHHALPSYDFDASLNLAHLLKTNKPLKKKNLTWLFIGLLVAIIVIPVVIRNTLQSLDIPFPTVDNLLSSLALVIFFIGLISALVYMILTFKKELIVHLLLPRVWAGILAGYSALIFESGSVEITCTLWNSPFLGIDWFFTSVLWLFMLFISCIYLYHDIRPWVIDKKKTRIRTAQTIFITLLLSILIGFIVVPLSTLAYNDPGKYCVQKSMYGIFGIVDIQQLSVFIPLAYITGLISQFIFEEKPLTTSVWAPIRE